MTFENTIVQRMDPRSKERGEMQEGRRMAFENTIVQRMDPRSKEPSHRNFFPSKLRTQVIPPSKLSLLDAVTCTNLLDRATC